MRQRERLLDEIRSFKMTTPYKDIARMLNSSVGTVVLAHLPAPPAPGEGLAARGLAQ
jgi:hypothetical protein